MIKWKYSKCSQGPQDIPFTHTNTGLTNRASVHYMLPTCKTLVDVLGNTSYSCHKQKSAKTIALEEYARDKGYIYVILLPKNYVKMTRGWKKFNDIMNSEVDSETYIKPTHNL